MHYIAISKSKILLNIISILWGVRETYSITTDHVTSMSNSSAIWFIVAFLYVTWHTNTNSYAPSLDAFDCPFDTFFVAYFQDRVHHGDAKAVERAGSNGSFTSNRYSFPFHI